MDDTARDRPIAVTDAADLDRIVAADPVVLVELHTEGCSICAAQEPVLSGVARTTDATVVTCNPRDDPALIERFDVRSVPAFVVFRDGTPVARRAAGFQSVDDIRELLDEARTGTADDDGARA
jgi:thioredoxin-like negative regulator of GroEL